jgi:hypothetical protein
MVIMVDHAFICAALLGFFGQHLGSGQTDRSVLMEPPEIASEAPRELIGSLGPRRGLG